MIDFVRAAQRALGPAGPRLRDLAASGAALVGLTDPLRRAKRCLTIVTFHRVLRDSERCIYPLPGLAVTPKELTWFMQYFTKHYKCGPLTETVDRWVSGRSDGMPLLALTFDDGQRDNYENARPILNRFRVRASFFVPVKHIEDETPIWHDRLGFAAMGLVAQTGGADRLRKMLDMPREFSKHALVPYVIRTAKDLVSDEREARIGAVEQLAARYPVPEWAAMMSWSELKVLRDEEHEIGSHSMTHPILSLCDDDEIRREVNDSRTIIEKRLGMNVTSFCYPNGSYNEQVISAVRRAGYRCAVTTSFGTNKSGSSLYTLRRCDMRSDHSRSHRGQLSQPRLALRLSGLQPGLPT